MFRKAMLYPSLMIIGVILGFIRELTVTTEFGLGYELDVYAVIFSVYLFFGVQISNAVEATFIAKYASLSMGALIQKMIGNQISIFIVVFFSVFSLFFFINYFVEFVFNFNAFQQQISINLYLAFIVAIIFSAISGLMRAVLNIVGNHTPVFISGTILSLSVILAVQFFSDYFGIISIPIGYSLGSVILFIIYYLCVKNKFSKNKGKQKFHVTHDFDIWKLSALVIIGELLFQGSYITERSISSMFGEGWISAYYLSISILMVFSAILVHPVNTVLFPIISRKEKNSPDELLKFVYSCCVTLILAGLSFSLIAGIFVDDVLRILFVRGKFTLGDAERVSGILKVLLYVIPFMSVAKILRNTIYSKGKYNLPIYANALRWIVLVVASSVLINKFDIRGLAMSYVMASATVPILYFIFLQTSKKEHNARK